MAQAISKPAVNEQQRLDSEKAKAILLSIRLQLSSQAE